MFYKDSSESTGRAPKTPTPMVESTRTKNRWLIQLAAVNCALCMVALILLGMPIRANAQTEHVFYIDWYQHVQEQYIPYQGTYHKNNPQQEANAANPAAKALLTGYWDGSVEHVFYFSSDNHVWELWSQANGAPWHGHDLTQNGPAPTANLSAGLTSYWDGSVGHVFYLNQSNNHVQELYQQPYGQWWGNDLTTNIANGPAIQPWTNSKLGSYFDGVYGHVFYTSNGDHVIQLAQQVSSQWRWQDLQYPLFCRFGVPCPQSEPIQPGSDITGYFDGSVSHVFYVGKDGHVHELYKNGNASPWGIWAFNDLFAAVPVYDTAWYNGYLTSYWDGQNGRVNYVSSNAYALEGLIQVGQSGPWQHDQIYKGDFQGNGGYGIVNSGDNALPQQLTSHYNPYLQYGVVSMIGSDRAGQYGFGTPWLATYWAYPWTYYAEKTSWEFSPNPGSTPGAIVGYYTVP